jgi:hypothetical protein
MGWFDDNGIDAAVQPERSGGGTGAPQMTTNAAPAAGGGDKGWLDWINATYGQSKARGTGFADLPQGTNLSQVIDRYNQETGANAKFLGGPSNDRVDFGQGATDALTAGGQLWSDYGAMSGPARNGASIAGGGQMSNNTGGYGGSGSSSTTTRGGGPPVVMPTAPGVQTLDAPTPFSYQGLGSLGSFQGPAAAAAPERLSYTAMATPTAFHGDRQATPGTLNAQNVDATKYEGLSAEDLAKDPSYQFRLKTQQDAFENSAASKGVLRTGNSARGIMDLSGQLASQEYAAADARARATNQMNNQTGLAFNQNANQNTLNFGNANIQNAFNANQANYGRASAEDQQGFANQFAVNQANNQGQNAATQANNTNAQQAQAQQFGQALGGYQANLAGQQQGYNQAAGTYGMNAQNALAYNQNANQNALANYAAQTNAALGLGNLNLGYQNSANSYNLGQGSLGLQQQGQNFNQGLALNQNAWNQNMGLANLGNPGAANAQGYDGDVANIYGQQGNAIASGQIGAANAYQQGLGNLTNLAGGVIAQQGNAQMTNNGVPYSGYPVPGTYT